jgi:hypothetical protein
MEPPVSVPMAATAEPSRTLAAAPEEEPPVRAVAELGVLAGDAVGQGMKMGFTGDDRAGCAQAADEP